MKRKFRKFGNTEDDAGECRSNLSLHTLAAPAVRASAADISGFAATKNNDGTQVALFSLREL